MEHLWWVAAAAVIGFLGNEAVAVFRINVGREIGSAALVADGQHARVDGFTSLSVLVGVIGTALGLPIVDPIVGIGIAIAILFIVKDAATSIWTRLSTASSRKFSPKSSMHQCNDGQTERRANHAD
jgi:divalent metal cation (Fe/Co/Zn/Cd) transporter